MTIRMKIIVLLLCSILTIAAGISAITFTTSKRFSDDQFTLNAKAQLDRVEELVDSFLNTGEQVSKALAQMPERDIPMGSLTSYVGTKEATMLIEENFNEREKAVYAKLYSASRLMPSVELALFGMEDGGYIKGPATPVSAQYDPRTRLWYKGVIEGGVDSLITDPYVSSSTKTLVTTVSARIKNSQGETVGVAGVDFILSDLTKTLQNAKVGRTGYLLLFDRKGRVMLDPQNPDNLMKPAGENDTKEIVDQGLKELAQNNADMPSVQRGGVDLVALSRVLGKTGWKAVMVMERSEAHAMGAALVKDIILVIAGLGLALILIGILIARSVTRPLNTLMDEVSDAAAGRFETLHHFNFQIVKNLFRLRP